MNRNKNISAAANKNIKESKTSLYERMGFKLGAEWADENPNWRLANSELPVKSNEPGYNRSSIEVLVYTNEGFYTKARYDFEYGEWYITEGEDLEGSLCFNDDEVVLCWMPFPKVNII